MGWRYGTYPIFYVADFGEALQRKIDPLFRTLAASGRSSGSIADTLSGLARLEANGMPRTQEVCRSVSCAQADPGLMVAAKHVLSLL